MIKLPQQISTYSPINRAWSQTNRSDVFGSFVGTFNVDLNSNLGKIRGTKMLQSTSQNGNYGVGADSSMTDIPVGFKMMNDSGNVIFTAAGANVHRNTGVPYGSFTVDAVSGTPTDLDSQFTDIEIFNGNLYVTGGNKLYKYTGAWASNALSGGGPWMMTPFGVSGGFRLYIAIAGIGKIYSTSDGTTIVTPNGIGSANTNPFTYDFGDTGLRMTFIRNTTSKIWIGNVNSFGGKGYVYEWDGSAPTVTASYRLESAGALACVIKDNIPWIVDANGKLMKFNNGNFEEMARFPIRQKFLYNATSATNNRFIHPNGMTVCDGKINILINNQIYDANGTIAEFCPSGIWEFDESTGSLYHKYSPSYTYTFSNIGTTIYDYGQNRVAAVGGLSEMKVFTTASNYNGTLMAGVKVYSDATNTDVGVFTNDITETATGRTPAQKSTYFVTSKFSSDQIQDVWRKLFIKHKAFTDSGDSLVVKYRTTEADPTEISLTWLTTNTFTTTTNVLGLEGYEVEVIQGTGSGKCAHITKIDVTAGVYTVTLDDTFTGATSTAKARLQNWKRIVLTATDQVLASHEFTINKAAEWIQLKVCFINKDRDEIDELIMVNTTHQNAQ